MQKEADKPQKEIVLGMIMMADENRWNTNTLFTDLNSQYAIEVYDVEETDSVDAFTVDSESVALMHIAAPIPYGDIEGTAKYAYNWPNALEAVSQHRSHIIVTIMRGSDDQIKRYKILTQVICSLLRTTNALGVYVGGQSLLIPKNDYLKQAVLMRDDYFPLNLWIYFGLRTTDSGKSD